MRMTMAVVTLAPVLAGMPLSAKAQEVAVPGSSQQYVLDIGAGIQYQPKYPGSNDYILVPFPLVAVQRFFLPGFGQVVDGREPKGTFRVPVVRLQWQARGLGLTRTDRDRNHRLGLGTGGWNWIPLRLAARHRRS